VSVANSQFRQNPPASLLDEHEIKPVIEGARVCLTYNLLQQRTGKKLRAITAPLYDSETDQAGATLKDCFGRDDAPTKLAWLLEHQYSPAGLSFAALKGRDAALAKVLRRASERAECALHLGIVHIEELGSAEPYYDIDYEGGRRWGSYYENEEDEVEDDDGGDTDFEVIEVFDGARYIDQWLDINDRPLEFGSLPVKDAEILPAGVLDGERPDQQRLTEATGNEGASFERSYHRAALVIWPQSRFVHVLLQAAPSAALPYLKDCVQACRTSSRSTVDQEAVHAVAERIIDHWESVSNSGYRNRSKESERSIMISLIAELSNSPLLERFVAGVVTREYDGGENEALAAHARRLGPIQAGRILSRLVSENMRSFPSECVDLLTRLNREFKEPEADWNAALRGVGVPVVEALTHLKNGEREQPVRESWRTQKAGPVDGPRLADLLQTLTALNAVSLRDAACSSIMANPTVFNPATRIVPALQLLRERGGEIVTGREFHRLWRHSAEFLLARSEYPPDAPKDWRQDAKISCRCGDCCELQDFVHDPAMQKHRFRVKKERRQHLHQQIDHHHLDMTHVTERIGSPQTLVCMKTRRTYERQLMQHQDDLVSMAVLLKLTHGKDEPLAKLAARMAAAARRQP
jgi:hypothetical protein